MQSGLQEDHPITIPERPFCVTLLAGIVLSLAGSNFLRSYESSKQYGFLDDILAFSPLFILFSGLFWGLVWLAVFFINWRGWRVAPSYTMVSAVLYLGYGWFDRLVISIQPLSNWQFLIGYEIGLLLLLVYFYRTRKVKAFFGENA